MRAWPGNFCGVCPKIGRLRKLYGVDRCACQDRTRQNGYGENFRGWRQEEKIASIAVPVCSQQRVIGCLNLVYIASAMTIEQAAQKHLPALQRVARQIEARMEEEEVWYEMP